METSTWGKYYLGNYMVKEQELILMVTSMKGTGKMGDLMVKELTYFFMELKGLQSSEMVDLGT